MIQQLKIRNFKSARKLSLDLAPLTVLAGLNGSGKSTVLQVLALLKQSSMRYPDLSKLCLTGELVRLGHSEDVWFENASEDEFLFSVRGADYDVSLKSSALPNQDELPIIAEGDRSRLQAQLSTGFQYIQADRITPAARYMQSGTAERESGWLGCGGEFAVDFLLRNADQKVSRSRSVLDATHTSGSGLQQHVAPTNGLLDQVAGWLQLISPGVRPRVSDVELADATSLRFAYTGTSIDSGSRDHRPTNVGFGLTYCLPIIVACLSAPAGALILLENPEAHLHPRGQSALGRLLAQCGADGVQIIAETHSDHLLNGIRIAVKNKYLPSESTAVHFFSRNIETGESSVISPKLHANGRFSEWPENFFDEWGKALDELLDI